MTYRLARSLFVFALLIFAGCNSNSSTVPFSSAASSPSAPGPLSPTVTFAILPTPTITPAVTTAAPAPPPAQTPRPARTPTTTSTPTSTPTLAPTLTPTPHPPSRFVIPDFTVRYLAFQPESLIFVRDFPDGIGVTVDRAVLEGRVRYADGPPDVELVWHLQGTINLVWHVLLVNGRAYLSVALDGEPGAWTRSDLSPELMNRVTSLLPPLATILSWDFLETDPWELLDGSICEETPCHQFSQSADRGDLILAVDGASLRPLSISVRSVLPGGRYTRATTEFVAWDQDITFDIPGTFIDSSPSELAYEFFYPLVILGLDSADTGVLPVLVDAIPPPQGSS